MALRISIGTLVVWFACFSTAPAEEEPRVEELRVNDVMDLDPELVLPKAILTWDPRLNGLWEQALRRPDTELQRLAADTIALAHQRSVPGLQATVAELARIVQQAETTPTVRRAMAAALVALDSKEHAAILTQVANQYGLELRIVIEPALARWGNDSMREIWRQRLIDRQTPSRLRVLAITGLQALRDIEAKPLFWAIVRNERAPANERWSAVEAIVAIGDDKILDDAQRLLADKSPAAIPNRLLGVHLLSAHRGELTAKLLSELSGDSEPAVAAAALDRLFRIDPKLVFPLAQQAVTNADVNVRRLGARAYLAREDVAGIEGVSFLLDDPNPALRRFVAKKLFDLAQKAELRAAVLVSADKALGLESWRGLEQGSLLAGHLGHKPAAERLIALLTHRREEVAISSAWALGQLKMPETFAPVLAHATREDQRRLDPKTTGHERNVIYLQLSQLFQFFGSVQLAEADPLMRKYIPKAPEMGDSRPAACWALGKIHEGKLVSDLAEKFAQRLTDLGNSDMPEFDDVRIMCAIGLGRMKAESGLSALRRFSVESGHVSLACWWSINRITGETPPKFKRLYRQIVSWFLQPIDP